MDNYGLVITFENEAKKRESPSITEKLRVPILAIRIDDSITNSKETTY